MRAVFLKTFRGHLVVMAFTAALVAGFGIVIATSYRDLGDAPFLGERMPRSLSAFLKSEGSLLLASGPQGYLAIGFRHPVFLVVLAAFSIATASGALAREIERRTVLLLLARPLPRSHLVAAKGLETAALVIAMAGALLAGIFIGSAVEGLTGVRAGPFLLAGVNAFLLGLAIAGYSYLLSASSSDGGRAVLLATGATVLQFLFDFLSGLFDFLEPLGLLSVFHYFDPVSVAVSGALSALHVAVLLSVATAGFGASLLVFQRRDIAA